MNIEPRWRQQGPPFLLSSKIALIALLNLSIMSCSASFSPLQLQTNLFLSSQRRVAIFAATGDSGRNDDNAAKQNESRAINSLPGGRRASDELSVSDFAVESSSTAVMITNEMKRVLIEELGYKRRDVDRMRVELAAPVISKRLRCPPNGMPAEWYRAENDDDGRYSLEKLESESRYPLKFPLLGVSIILAGKGLTDAIITVIKVQQGFTGASLSAKFMGLPVLGIDALCIVAGVGLGVWTWRSMQD